VVARFVVVAWLMAVVLALVEGVEGGEVKSVRHDDSEDLLLMAAENLKRSIEFAIGQLRAKKVPGEVKLRWSRSLTRQVEALVKVAEALSKIGCRSTTNVDLASYLSSLETRVPRKLVSRKFSKIVEKFSRSGLRYGRR